jgi:hypothetical protein
VALDSAPLREHLIQLFSGQPEYPASEAVAAAALAGIYGAYAAGATAGPTVPTAASLAAAETTLSSALEAAFAAAKSAGAAGVPSLASDMNAAFVSFWMGPPVVLEPVAGPSNVTGVVTMAPPAVLAGAFIDLFTRGVKDDLSAGQQAGSLATVLDAWTRTVLVVNTPPGSPAVPLV